MIHFQIEIKNKFFSKSMKKTIDRLNIKYVKSKEKVAYYYEDMERGNILSFNENITFYAASTIKILAVLYLYEEKIDLNQKIIVTENDKKRGSGQIKEESLPKEYTLKELALYTLKYSDNTAYLKLVNWITKENLESFGKKLGAKHAMEGKDNFGVTSCADLRIFWSHIYKHTKTDKDLRDALENPSYQIVLSKSIQKQIFLRKYGAFDIATHECGIVEGYHPYYLIIMTQKGKTKQVKKWINHTAKKIHKIHNKIQRKETLCQKSPKLKP